MSDSYEERHGTEPTGDTGCEGLVPDPEPWAGEPFRIKIDGLPADLPPGEYRMRFSGYAEHPGDGTAVLRFRYVNMADEMSPADQQRLGAAMVQTREMAEAEGWLPPREEERNTWPIREHEGWLPQQVPDLYQVSTVETINVSKLARIITQLVHKGVLDPAEIGLVPDPDSHLTPGVEDWLRS